MAMFQAQTAPAAAQVTQTSKAKAPATQQGLFAAGGALQDTTASAVNAFGNYIKSNPYSYSGAPAIPSVNDFSADRQRIEDTLFNHTKQDLDTRYNNESAAFEQRMANEGVDIGTPRYKMEKELFEKGRNQAYNDARYQAIVGGAAEQDRMFNNALAARKLMTSEDDNLRTARVNDLAALLTPATAANNAATTEKIAADERNFKKKENAKDRQVKREEIRAAGDGGAMDLPSMIKIIEQLTGEKFSS